MTIWINSADSAPLKAMYDSFQKVTGHTLNIVSIPSDGFETALLQKWATGDRPDILEWQATFNWVAAIDPETNLRDLSNEAFVSREKDLLANNASLAGKVYGVILNAPLLFGLFYNKDVFTKLNLKPPTNAQELLDVCKAIKTADPTITPLFETVGSQWPPLVQNAAFMGDRVHDGFFAAVQNRTAKLNQADSPWLAAAKYYLQLRDAGCYNKDYLTAKFENDGTTMMAGKTAMLFQQSEVVQECINASTAATVNKSIGFQGWSEKTPIVTGEAGVSGTYYLPKTGNAGKEAAALDFIHYMTGPAYIDYVKAAGLPPTLSGVDVPDTVSEPLKEAAAQASKGSTEPIWHLTPGITDLLTGVDKLAAGQLTPQELVDLMQSEAEQGAKAANLPPWP